MQICRLVKTWHYRSNRKLG